MKTAIQLKHPTGKKAISMDKVKYDLIKNVLTGYLKSSGASTHKEILKTVTQDFKKNKVKFEGSIEWHMEWVKLDLESRKVIKRITDKPPLKFEMA